MSGIDEGTKSAPESTLYVPGDEHSHRKSDPYRFRNTNEKILESYATYEKSIPLSNAVALAFGVENEKDNDKRGK